MKRIGAAALLTLAGCSALTTHSAWMRPAAPGGPPGPDEAKVIVFRPWTIPESKYFPIYDGDRLVGFAEMLCYFEYRCKPGRHTFLSWGENDRFVDAELSGGKTYYIECYSKFGWWSPGVGLEPVVAGSEDFGAVEGVLNEYACRELDPGTAGEVEAFVALKRERVERMRAAFEEGRKAGVRSLRPEDGR